MLPHSASFPTTSCQHWANTKLKISPETVGKTSKLALEVVVSFHETFLDWKWKLLRRNTTSEQREQRWLGWGCLLATGRANVLSNEDDWHGAWSWLHYRSRWHDDDSTLSPLLHNFNSWTVHSGPSSLLPVLVAVNHSQSELHLTGAGAHFLPDPLCNYPHRPGVKHGNGGISHPNDDLPESMSPSSLTRWAPSGEAGY